MRFTDDIVPLAETKNELYEVVNNRIHYQRRNLILNQVKIK